MLCKLHPYFQNIFFTLLSALSDNSSVPLPQPLVIPKVFSVFVVLPVLSVCLHAQSYPTLCNPMESSRLVCPWDFPDKNTGVGCHFLPHMIFLTQGLSPHLLCLLYWQADSLSLNHWGSHHINGTVKYLSFCVCVILLNMSFSKVIKVVAGIRSSFLFMSE